MGERVHTHMEKIKIAGPCVHVSEKEEVDNTGFTQQPVVTSQKCVYD